MGMYKYAGVFEDVIIEAVVTLLSQYTVKPTDSCSLESPGHHFSPPPPLPNLCDVNPFAASAWGLLIPLALNALNLYYQKLLGFSPESTKSGL